VVILSSIIWEELVRTRFVFSAASAGLEDSHILIPEDFVGGVVVLEFREVWGQMGHEVFVVDHSVDVLDLVVHVLCQVCVADPRGSVGMDLDL
jgi:hypothetical protein